MRALGFVMVHCHNYWLSHVVGQHESQGLEASYARRVTSLRTLQFLLKSCIENYCGCSFSKC